MSKKLKMPQNGLFGLPSSVRQTNSADDPSTQVPENLDTEEPSYPRTKESRNSDTSMLDNSSTVIPKNSDTKESEILGTQVLENLDSKKLSHKEDELLAEIIKNSDIQESNFPSTQVLKKSSIQVPEDLSTKQLEVQDTPVAKGPSTKVSGYQGVSELPKPQKNNRTKDDKKPARKQASVHLTGTTPVSYTHLRAHETRHDLVCRLLLEKKKQLYTNTHI